MALFFYLLIPVTGEMVRHPPDYVALESCFLGFITTPSFGALESIFITICCILSSLKIPEFLIFFSLSFCDR